MKVLSWNIYFDDESGKVRYPKIINYLQNSHYDLICLQEVTQKFLRKLDLEGFESSEICNSSKYQNIILSRGSITGKGILSLTSDLGRKAPFIDLAEDIRVFSVHLESMLEDTQKRLIQLEEILSSSTNRNILICGDMNFGDDDLEQDFVRNNLIDVGSIDKAFTFDIIKNDMAQINRFDDEVSRRLDRFLIKGNIEYTNYKVIDTYESDHFPIAVEIST